MTSTLVAAVSVAILAFLGFAVYPGESVHCWVCSSEVDQRCADPFNMTYYALTDCDRQQSSSSFYQTKAVCRKAKQRVQGELIVVRSCSWEADGENYPDGPCPPQSSQSYVKTEYCTVCSKDACNIAVTSSVHTYVSVLVPFVYLVCTRFVPLLKQL